MKQYHDLSSLNWMLSGWVPFLWRLGATVEVAAKPDAVVNVPAIVPGSVQQSLRKAGVLPDWNMGLNAQQCEWVENRHWIYETVLPGDWVKPEKTYWLKCLGLDYSGMIFLNGVEIATFRGTHVPHEFDLTPHLKAENNTLRIVFDLVPRWLGQVGYSSRMTEWKPRFNYTWDWIPRLVQLGIWDEITLEEKDTYEIVEVRTVADVDVAAGTGQLSLGGQMRAAEDSTVQITLTSEGQPVRQQALAVSEFNAQGAQWSDIPVKLWWPNGEGEQPLYEIVYELRDSSGAMQDRSAHVVGFVDIQWRSCEGASPEADPWLCVVNGRPVFLQGVNFPPMLPNFADVSEEAYRTRLQLYRDLGVNTFRINACQFLEKDCFYRLCNEMGLLVWQECPLTSSGIENIPPRDEQSIEGMAQIAESFIRRRRHHPCVLLWSGGNELCELDFTPIGTEHPMLARLAEVAAANDPKRRFIPSSPSGPTFDTPLAKLGQGVAWDVHGPWKWGGDLKECEEYYAADDALFRSEAGSPGASPVTLIQRYRGSLNPLPINATNPLWRNPVGWWIEADAFTAEQGHSPEDLVEYVAWSQARQARALVIAVGACKRRFPRCGGVLLWCGHDCFPCPANTSIIDFDGQPKPAALALAEIWRAKPGQ